VQGGAGLGWAGSVDTEPESVELTLPLFRHFLRAMDKGGKSAKRPQSSTLAQPSASKHKAKTRATEEGKGKGKGKREQGGKETGKKATGLDELDLIFESAKKPKKAAEAAEGVSGVNSEITAEKRGKKKKKERDDDDGFSDSRGLRTKSKY